MLTKEDVNRRVRASSMERSRGGNAYGIGFHYNLQTFFDSIGFIDRLHHGDRVLEMGCGDGRTIQQFAATYRVKGFGVDIIRPELYMEDRQLARGFQQVFGFMIEVSDFEDLSSLYSDEFFKYVFSYGSFIYAYNLLQGVSEAHRLLQSGGLALLHLGDQAGDHTHPSIDEIVDAYPNDGQLELVKYKSRIPARDLFNLNKSEHHRALVVHKTSAERLVFPDHLRTEPGPEFIEGSTICHYDC